MCSLPKIPFSTYIKKPENFNRTYMTGERITLACKKGFKEQPRGNPVRICINGLWTRFPFKCESMLSMQTYLQAPSLQFLERSLSFSNVTQENHAIGRKANFINRGVGGFSIQQNVSQRFDINRGMLQMLFIDIYYFIENWFSHPGSQPWPKILL